ncbi:transposase [Enterobacillus tribolii]|uniref:Transposase n=1 Tax=Enterobacillus tribolii TaxID=1487935 RepID=A0A370Q5A7_9GAMM|nr:hypothetical protein [Enterobacillus tribolii]RDK83555.1 transposase [Enterobacillus tribolii]
MSAKRYPDEFKIKAVKLITDDKLSVADVAQRLGVTTHSLYAWMKKFGPNASSHKAEADVQYELRRLQRELKRVTEERNMLKKAKAYFAKLSG